MKDERYLDRSRRMADPWGTPFRIHCAADELVVISAGPDLAFGTEDDIDAATRR